MLFGIFRPTIILPEGYTPESEQEFAYILAHEYQHYRHKDNLWQLLMLAALCLHWFNPIVWLVYRLFLADIEAACDERVLDHLSTTDKQNYAHVVLDVAERYHHSKPLMAMGFAKVRLKDRIKWIVNHKKVGITAGILSAVLILVVATVLGTGAMKDNETESVDNTNDKGATTTGTISSTATTTTMPPTSTTTTETVTTTSTTRPLEVLTYKNVTWKEVPFKKESGFMDFTDSFFELGSAITTADYVFSGTVISIKEYESYSTDDEGKVWGPSTESIVEVKVDQTYHGQLPIQGNTIKILYSHSFSRDLIDSVIIKEKEDYVFITRSLDIYADVYPESLEFADVYITHKYCWDVFPIENENVFVIEMYFDWNQGIMQKAKPDIETDRISSGKTGDMYMVLDKKDFDKAFTQLLNNPEILLPLNTLLPYDTTKTIVNDYVTLWKEKAKKEDGYAIYENLTADKVQIDAYFGTYNGCTAVMITDDFTAYDLKAQSWMIGKTRFTCENGLVVSFYKDGKFKNVYEAFEAKWISEADIKKILEITKKWEPNISPDYTPNPLNPEELTDATKKRIKVDWASSKTEFLRLEDITINQYLGRYDGAIALRITDNKTYYDQAVHKERIAGYDFTFNSGQRIMVYHDGKFVRLETAYGLSWIDKRDVRDILWHYSGK